MSVTVFDFILFASFIYILGSTASSCYAYTIMQTWWRIPILNTAIYGSTVVGYLTMLDAFITFKSSLVIVSALVTIIFLNICLSFSSYLFMHVLDKEPHMDREKIGKLKTIFRVIVPWRLHIYKSSRVLALVISVIFAGYIGYYMWYKHLLINQGIYQLETDEMLSKIKCRFYKPAMLLDNYLTQTELKCVNK